MIHSSEDQVIQLTNSNTSNFREKNANLAFEGNVWIFNGETFQQNGLLIKSIPISDIDIDGIMPTPAEVRRFKATETNMCTVCSLNFDQNINGYS